MSIEVVDNLINTNAYAALSANQGRILYNMITNVATDSDIDSIFD